MIFQGFTHDVASIESFVCPLTVADFWHENAKIFLPTWRAEGFLLTSTPVHASCLVAYSAPPYTSRREPAVPPQGAVSVLCVGPPRRPFTHSTPSGYACFWPLWTPLMRSMTCTSQNFTCILFKLQGVECWSIRVNGNWRLVFDFQAGHTYILDYKDHH